MEGNHLKIPLKGCRAPSYTGTHTPPAKAFLTSAKCWPQPSQVNEETRQEVQLGQKLAQETTAQLSI